MKKLFSIILITVMCFTVSGCKASDSNEFTKLVKLDSFPENAYWGQFIWSDGKDAYHSFSNDNFIFKDSKMEPVEWNIKDLNGTGVWSDGKNTYFTDSTVSYMLNDGKWVEKKFSGGPKFFHGYFVWSDGENTYYSDYSQQYVLKGDTWVEKEWVNFEPDEMGLMTGDNIWSDGTNIYYSEYDEGYTDEEIQYVLKDGEWVKKDWKGFNEISGSCVWNANGVTYYSSGADQYVLKNGKWEKKKWDLPKEESIFGDQVWSYGSNHYYSFDGYGYRFE